MGMPQLPQLYCPFHVGEAAPTEFGVCRGIGAPWQPFGLHPCLDPPDLPRFLRGQSTLGITQWVHDVDESGAEIVRSEEHTSELQSRENLVCRLLLEK